MNAKLACATIEADIGNLKARSWSGIESENLHPVDLSEMIFQIPPLRGTSMSDEDVRFSPRNIK
jgi:hypothetical protein